MVDIHIGLLANLDMWTSQDVKIINKILEELLWV